MLREWRKDYWALHYSPLNLPRPLHPVGCWVSSSTEQAVAGTIHNVLLGKLDTEFHSSLMDNTELLDRVAARNAEMNANNERTYMLSQVGSAIRCAAYGS